MRLTVLGKSPSWQDADGACSGYLLEDGDTAVLLDCGNGVFSKLRKFRDYTAVNAVVLSHLHADHFLDLVPYSYALTYAPRQQPVPVDRWPGTDNPCRPKLYAPKGAVETFRRVAGAWGNEDLIEKAFDIEEYHENSSPEIGTIKFHFHAVPHFIETYASLRGVDERRRQADLRRRLPADRHARPVRARNGAAPHRGHPAAAGADRHARPPHAA